MNMAAILDSYVGHGALPREVTDEPDFPDDEGKYEEFDYIVSKYILSFIWIPALIVNTLIIIVFSMPGLKNSQMSFLFRVLAVFDMLAVLNSFESLREFHFEKYPDDNGRKLRDDHDGDYDNEDMYINIWDCVFWEFYYNTVRSICSWILLAISLERSIGLRYPHIISTWFTRRREILYIVCVTVVMMAFYATYFFMIETDFEKLNHDCQIKNAAHRYVLAWGNLCLYCLVPFIIIAISNISIIVVLVKLKGQEDHQDLMTNKTPDPNVRTMTTMLLVVSFTSILLTAPIAVYNVWNLVYESDEGGDLGQLLWPLGLLCATLNHSVNFFVYCMISGTFRANLKQLFCGKKPQSDTGMTNMNDMETHVSEDTCM